MSVATVPFIRGMQAVADSAGNAQIVMGPEKANESWNITHMEGSNPGPRTPTIYVYKNVLAPSGFFDGTLNGLFAATDTPLDLQSSEVVIWQWSLCTPGTVCTVNVRGDRTYAF